MLYTPKLLRSKTLWHRPCTFSKAVHIKSVNLLLGKPLKPASVVVRASVTTLSDVEQVVNTVEAIKVCSGGIKGYPKAEPECAYDDPRGKWRHSRCTMTVAEGSVCKARSYLCDTLRIRTSRQVGTKKGTQAASAY